MSNPMEQFVIKPIIPLKVGDVDISFTNSSLFYDAVRVGGRSFVRPLSAAAHHRAGGWRNRFPNAYTVLLPI